MNNNKPIHVKPTFYSYCFENLKQIALNHGYNLVLHGSLNRDLDLIAIPWSDELGNKETMVKEFAEYLGGDIIHVYEENFKNFKQIHHGRESYLINMNREHIEGNEFETYYLDISILPAIKYNEDGTITEINPGKIITNGYYQHDTLTNNLLSNKND